MKTAKEILQGIQELKPLSPSVGKLAELVSNPDTDSADVVNVIKFDQALTLDVLKLANSAMSGSRKEISSIKEAVVRLGGERILKHVITKGVSKQMQVPMEVYGYEEFDLWKHSVATAILSEDINTFIDGEAKMAFTTGLLHDIGKLVLGRVLEKENVLKIWKCIDDNPGMSDEQAERKILGLSHSDLGYAICKKWGLPEDIAYGILYHHNNADGQNQLTDCLRVANILARMIGAGLGREGLNVFLDDEVIERLNLKNTDIEILCANGSMKLVEVLESFK